MLPNAKQSFLFFALGNVSLESISNALLIDSNIKTWGYLWLMKMFPNSFNLICLILCIYLCVCVCVCMCVCISTVEEGDSRKETSFLE